MRILIVQPVPPATWAGRHDYADDVARLGARLRQKGHEPSLLLLSRYDEEALRLNPDYAEARTQQEALSKPDRK